MNKELLAQIIDDLDSVLKQKHLMNVSDDLLFDAAIRIYNTSHLHSAPMAPKEFGSLPTSSEPLATEKQLFLLKKWNIPNAEYITKKEAMRIITERKGDKNEKNLL